MGSYIGLIQKNKQLLKNIVNVLLSIPSALVALAAALSQCKEDFNEEVFSCNVYILQQEGR